MEEAITEMLAKSTRLAKIQQLNLLDGQDELAFDRLTRFAIKLLHVPTAFLSIVTATKQVFKSQIGLAESYQIQKESPIAMSYCQYVVAQNKPLIIRDARKEAFLKDDLAIGELEAIGYIGIPIALSDGTVVGSFCVVDNKPRDWTEDEITTMRELAQMVITELELRAELIAQQRAQRQILDLILEKQRAELLGTFIRDVMHEFKTPITTIKTKSYLAKRLDESGKASRYLDAIDEQADRINELVDSLVLLVRLEDHDVFDFNKGSINDNLRVAYDKFKERIAEKQIVVNLDLAPDMPIIAYDSGAMTLAFTELLENAVRYTGLGGHITLKTQVSGQNLMIVVADDGAGITPLQLPYIFDRFTHDDLPQSNRGLGVGLTIAQKVIQKHHGTIEVESELNKGTTFTITIPLQPANY